MIAKFAKLSGLFLLGMHLTGCEGLEGPQPCCIHTQCEAYGLKAETGEYVSGNIRIVNRSGENVEEQETAWVSETNKRMAANEPGTYHESSPHTGEDYKFVVTCLEWEQPPAYVPPTYEAPSYTAPAYSAPAYTAPQPSYPPAYTPTYSAPAFNSQPSYPRVSEVPQGFGTYTPLR